MFISRITNAKFAISQQGLTHVYVSYVISILGVRLNIGNYDDLKFERQNKWALEIIRSYPTRAVTRQLSAVVGG